MELRNTAALVTGGASGLGAAAARALAARGAQVFAADLGGAIERAPVMDGVTYVDADVVDAVCVSAAVDRVAECGVPLRTVVNCAGIAAYMPVLSGEGRHDLDLFRRIVDINLVGTFNVMAITAEAIANTETLSDDVRGVLINTASIGAYDGLGGTAAYSASKNAVIGLTLPSARDLAAYGIRVMAIAPGIFDTPMFSMGRADDEVNAHAGKLVPLPKRLGRPDEFGQLVVDVVERDYLNGTVIRFDGALRLG